MMHIFFDGWESIVRILISAPVLYLAVVCYIRVLGKRSISKMNNFDWIVTVAIGSMVASGIVLEGVPLLPALVGIFLLLGIQYALTSSMQRFPKLQKVFKSSPTLLYYQGEFLHENMRSERVLESEIYAAIREAGCHTVEDIEAVILETDAKLTVLSSQETDDLSNSLRDVMGLPEELATAFDQQRTA